MNVGSVTQLALEGAPLAAIRALVEFTTRVGLPNTLTEVGIDVDDLESLTIVVGSATATGDAVYNMPFEVTTEPRGCTHLGSCASHVPSDRTRASWHQ